MMVNDDVLKRINERYGVMTKRQKQLARYIIENYDKSAFVTAAKLGAAVGASESTVVRFAYALGYEGYPELQRALQELIRHRLTTLQRMQLSADIDPDNVLRTTLKADMNNIRDTLECISIQVFERVVNSIVSARTVYILGLRSSTPLTQFLGHYLNFVLEDVRVVNGENDIYEQLLRISGEDLLFGVSFPRYSSRTVEAMRFAREQGAHVVALTDAEASPLAAFADETLCAKSNMASYADSLVAPLSLINAIIVAVGLMKKDDVSARFSKLEALWDTQGVYIHAGK